MSGDLEIRVDELPQGPVLRLKGDPGVGAGEVLQSEITRLCDLRPSLVVLDLAELVLVSSLVMGQFINLQRSITRSGGRLRMASVQPRVMESFRRAALDRVFQIYGDVPQALENESATNPPHNPAR